MTPEMVKALFETSLFYSVDPDEVCSHIVEIVGSYYDIRRTEANATIAHGKRPTMTMLNLLDGDCIRLKTVCNRHRLFVVNRTLDAQLTLCQVALQNRAPLLVQNAELHPEFCHHPVVRLKLRRYLGVPIWNTAGEAIGTLCILDDHTEDLLGDEDIQFLSLLAMRISAEIERERTILARIEEKSNYAAQLERTADAKRSFVSMVIHDLRHPLTSIMTELYLLQQTSRSEKLTPHIDALDGRVRLMTTLLDELMLYDQVEAGKSLLKLEPVEIAAFLHQCVERVAAPKAYPEVNIIYEIEPNLPDPITDSGKLRHVVMNLVANAVKYTRQGSITIRAGLNGSHQWYLQVADTGVGMTAFDQARVFEPYYSGTGDALGGAGLGLAIAHRLCTALQGEMTMTSESGTGSLVAAVFPLQIRDAGDNQVADQT